MNRPTFMELLRQGTLDELDNQELIELQANLQRRKRDKVIRRMFRDSGRMVGQRYGVDPEDMRRFLTDNAYFEECCNEMERQAGAILNRRDNRS